MADPSSSGPIPSKTPVQTAPWVLTPLHNPAGSKVLTSLHVFQPLDSSTNVGADMHRLSRCSIDRNVLANAPRRAHESYDGVPFDGRTSLVSIGINGDHGTLWPPAASFDLDQEAVQCDLTPPYLTQIPCGAPWRLTPGKRLIAISERIPLGVPDHGCRLSSERVTH
jgi:hypothetical protein